MILTRDECSWGSSFWAFRIPRRPPAWLKRRNTKNWARVGYWSVAVYRSAATKWVAPPNERSLQWAPWRPALCHCRKWKRSNIKGSALSVFWSAGRNRMDCSRVSIVNKQSNAPLRQQTDKASRCHGHQAALVLIAIEFRSWPSSSRDGIVSSRYFLPRAGCRQWFGSRHVIHFDGRRWQRL